MRRRRNEPEPKPEGKDSGPISFANWLDSQPTGGIGHPSDAQLEGAFEESSIVGACVNEIVDAMTALKVETSGVPYIKLLLERPSPHKNWEQFIGDFMRRYLCTGAGFIWKQREGGVLAGIRSVPTSAVQWLPDDRFSLAVNGNHMILAWSDLPGLLIEAISSTHDWMSLLGSAWLEIELDSQRGDYQRTVLDNLADASLVIESTQPNSKEQRADLRESIEQSAGGAHRGGLLVMPPGFKATSPGKMRDIALTEVSRLSESRISAVLNVPVVLTGLEAGLAQMTYSNYTEARESFYTETILPLAKILSEFLTRVLIEEEGMSGTIVLVRDPSTEREPATVAPLPVKEADNAD